MPNFAGTSGADTFAAPTAEDWIIDGKGGADILTGNAGRDTLSGGPGNDTLDGGEGDDIFLFGASGGLDVIIGGAGYDLIQAIADNVKIGIASLSGIEEISSGGFFNVTVLAGEGDDVLDFSAIALSDIAAVNAGGGNDTVIGTVNDDYFIGGYGNDVLKGGAGNDILDGGPGNDVLEGGAGDDTFLVGRGAGFDTFKGGAGYDVILGNADDTVIRVGLGHLAGIQEINSGGFSNVTIAGAAGIVDDVINLSGVILTDGDIASINGGEGNDTITASKISDYVIGGAGNDILKGLAGDDTLEGGLGNDTLDGGAGFDTLIGGAGSDSLTGAYGDDTLQGDAGNDVLNGGGGFDSLDGGDGADLLTGGAAFDTLTGGAGADLFSDTVLGLKGDTITDFTAEDKIQILGVANPEAVSLSFAAGVLTVDVDGAGGVKPFGINLVGSFDASSFHAISDGAGGVFISVL